MKYVVTWEQYQNTSEEQQARSLQVFSKWSPDERVDFQQFLGRVDGQGGFSVVETDELSLLAKEIALFSPFFEFKVYPVLEIAQTAEIGVEAVAMRQSID